MFSPISFFRSLYSHIPPLSLQALSSNLILRTQEAAIAIFSKSGRFIKKFNCPSELNLKTIAMISCLSLIALIVISMLRRRDTSFLLPSTPPNPPKNND